MTHITHTGKIRSLPFFVLAILAGVLIASMAVVATLAVDNLGTKVIRPGSEEFSLDADSTIVNTAISKAAATTAASGDTTPGSDATIGLVQINEALTADNWTYKFEVIESGVNTWGATRTYKVEVYADGVAQTTLYFNNATINAATVEGVTVKVDLGSGNLPDTMSVVVTKVIN
ncbi:MAG: hypothetical protein AAB037_03095 [Chloroflexota bacterium]